MFYLYGTAISAGDAKYLLTTLGAIGTPEAMDAAEMIAMGITGRRKIAPLSPAMQDAVWAALDDAPSDALAELRTKVSRKTLLTREW